MKQIKRIHWLLYAIIMFILSTQLLLENSNCSTKNKSKTNKSKTNKRESIKKTRRNKKNRRKKKGIQKKEFLLNDITPEAVEETVEKAVSSVNPEVIFEKGQTAIESFGASKEEQEHSIKVGNYYITVPEELRNEGITKEKALALVEKLSSILNHELMAAMSDQFRFHAQNMSLQSNDNFKATYDENKKQAIELIKNAPFEINIKANGFLSFYKDIVLAALKTIMESNNESWLSKAAFWKKSSLYSQFYSIVNKNKLIQEVDYIKGAKEESKKSKNNLPIEVAYCAAAIAYNLVHNKSSDLFESDFFNSMITAITIPTNAQGIRSIKDKDDATVSAINLIAQKTMRNSFYDLMLKYYEINKKDMKNAFKEADSGIFVIDSTMAYYGIKALKWGATAALLAAGGVLASEARDYYKMSPEEKEKYKEKGFYTGGKEKWEKRLTKGGEYAKEQWNKTGEWTKAKVNNLTGKTAKKAAEEAAEKAAKKAAEEAAEEAAKKAAEEAAKIPKNAWEATMKAFAITDRSDKDTGKIIESPF
jgi:hypothetical protein